VTEKAGVSGGTFGMGVAIGDYSNDGCPIPSEASPFAQESRAAEVLIDRSEMLHP
jgi:hypothetical protein